MKKPEQYGFMKGLRPFSLVVAWVAAALGILLAWQDGFQNPWYALLVVMGAVFSQAGINLINDLEDLSQLRAEDTELRQLIHFNARVGAVLLVIAVSIGVYLTYVQGWPVLVLVGVALALALSYNLGPINFKRRGLALVQVFLLMGVCLVEGAYLSMSGHFSVEALYLSFPVSVLISLLLLSNELRDWEADKALGMSTLTVRIGYPRAVSLYAALVVVAYLLALFLIGAERLHLAWYLLLPLPLLFPIARLLRASERPALTPMTGRFFLLFGFAWLLVVGQ